MHEDLLGPKHKIFSEGQEVGVRFWGIGIEQIHEKLIDRVALLSSVSCVGDFSYQNGKTYQTPVPNEPTSYGQEG